MGLVVLPLLVLDHTSTCGTFLLDEVLVPLE